MRATRHGHGVIFLQQTQSFWLVSLHLNSGHEDGKETTQHHFHVFFLKDGSRRGYGQEFRSAKLTLIMAHIISDPFDDFVASLV